MNAKRLFIAGCISTLVGALASSAAFAERGENRVVIGPVLFQAAGPNAASIQSSVDAYRAQLGTLNANVAGSFGSGRREINWDGVPDGFAAPNNLPPNFFNVNSPRGVIFDTPGSGFQVSAKIGNPTNTPVRFGNINSTYPDLFSVFSPQRLFTALESNILYVHFFVAGSNTRATTKGFGAVFTDVDLPADQARCGRAHHTRIIYFDENGTAIFESDVPASGGDAGLSFLGAFFPDHEISTVGIVSGSTALGPDEEGCIDIVAMDDFIYGEPRAAP